MKVFGGFTVTSVLAAQSNHSSNIKAKNPECSSPEESSAKFFFCSLVDRNYSNYNEMLNKNFP